jgi:hypothetical protein
MSGGLDNFAGESDDSGAEPTKTTYYQFENPEHPESKEFDNPERAAEHFQAARYVQDYLGTQRHALVGEFLVAVQAIEDEDDEEPLQDLVDRLVD